MKKELKEAWIEKLNDPKYIQGFGQEKLILNDGTCIYCALGLLGEVLVEKGIAKWFFSGQDDYAEEYYVGFSYLLDGANISESERNSIIGLNDMKKNNFKQIAEIVDKHIPSE